MIENTQPVQKIEIVETPIVDPSSVLEYLVVQRSELGNIASEYQTYRSHMDTAQFAVSRYVAAVDSKSDNLEIAFDDITHRLIQIRSSMTIAVAYIQITNELGDQYTPLQIKDIFVQGLKISDDISRDRLTSASNEENKRKIKLRQAHWQKLDQEGKRHYMEQFGVTPPAWYEGTRSEWWTLIINHGNFSYSLNRDRVKKVEQTPVGAYVQFEDGVLELGNTVRGDVPDWYDDLEEKLPTVEEIETEYDRDEEELGMYIRLHEENVNQIRNMKNLLYRRFIKAAAHFELGRKNLESGSDNIFKALLYLDVNKTTNEYTFIPDPDDIDIVKFNNSVILAEKSSKRATEGFVDRLSLTPEVVALWVEDVLQDGKVPPDIEALRGIVDFMSKSPSKEELYELKEKDKKLHNVLKYKLLPLFALLSLEEVMYLKEIVTTVDSPFEFIAEFGQIASQQIDALQREPELAPLVKELRLFSANFLNQNKDNFANKVRQILLTVGITEKPEEKPGVVPELAEVSEAADEIEEDLKRTSIANWNLQLSDGYHLVTGRREVEGETLEDYEDAINTLFQKTGRAFSIKTLSMVRALDWFLNIPEEFLRIWPKEKINGVEYYKINRGAVRIFCHLDRKAHNLTFFPYQKTDMEYHFRS